MADDRYDVAITTVGKRSLAHLIKSTRLSDNALSEGPAREAVVAVHAWMLQQADLLDCSDEEYLAAYEFLSARADATGLDGL